MSFIPSIVPPPCPPALPQRMLAVGKGGWSFPVVFLDENDNPVDLTVGGLTPTAYFYQGNTDTTTPLTVAVVNASAGQATALVPSDVVLSTLYPAPGARLLPGSIGIQPAPLFRLYAYLVDSLGSRTSEQILAIQPVDWRRADPGALPVVDVTYISVGPSGPRGLQGLQGAQGIPGGIIPYSGQAASTVTQYGVVASLVDGLHQVSSADMQWFGKVSGVALVAANAGQTVNYAGLGPVDNGSWNWPIGPLYFDNFGALTASAPTGGFQQQVATAITPTRIVIDLGEPEVVE